MMDKHQLLTALVTATVTMLLCNIYNNLHSEHNFIRKISTKPTMLNSQQMLYILGMTTEGQGQQQQQQLLVDSSGNEYLDYIRAHISKPAPGPINLSDKPKPDEIKHYSQVGQSKLIDSLLHGRTNGFFIECGAWDGEHLSNSLFFELYRNWTGLLIEANPARHGQLLAKNRQAYVMSACISPTGRPTQLSYASADNRFVGGIESYMIDSYAKAVAGNTKSVRSRVPCFPLIDILAALGVNHIDYLSLDVDGAELEILRSIDWKRVRIDTLTVEYVGPTKLNALRRFFNGTAIYREVDNIAGYELVYKRVVQ